MGKRYKGIDIPAEQLAANSSDEMLMLTAVLGALIGIVRVVMGRTGKPIWMWAWGYGLVLSSLYLGWLMQTGVYCATSRPRLNRTRGSSLGGSPKSAYCWCRGEFHQHWS